MGRREGVGEGSLSVRSTYPAVLLDARCCHEAFRRFGFSADDIFMHVAQNVDAPGTPWLFAVLKAQGKTFTITVGPLEGLEPEELLRLWTALAADFNARDRQDAELIEIWENGLVWRLGPANLAVGLANKGFTFRKGFRRGWAN